jgi:tRNA-dihydrouridine synthase B
MLRIGAYELRNNVALAPMAGVTDLPFRRLVARLGAGLVVSEMIAARPDLAASHLSRARRAHAAEASPRSVQLAGADPAQMARAAVDNVAAGAQVIDLNMGCPAKRVCRQAAGSALLAEPELARAIIRAVVAAAGVPVTLKMRTGVDPGRRNGVEIARMAEAEGIQLLAVHGRTRACRFTGPVEYDTIARIKAAVRIPVLANGDIDSPRRAAEVLARTGADGVMVGRSAQGDPWLPGRIAGFLARGVDPGEPDAETRRRVLREHVAALHDFHGPVRGLLLARRHVGHHLDRWWPSPALRRQFNALDSTMAQLAAIELLIPGHEERQAA